MVDTLLKGLLAAMIGIVGYSYFGYPLLLGCIAPFKKKPGPFDISKTGFPTVSILIAAHNEEMVIDRKIKNTLSLKYSGTIEVIVCSDASTDRTDAIVRGYETDGVVLVSQSEHLGKTACLNKGVMRASGDIIVFSDANSMYDEWAIQHLVAPFADSSVGYVVGHQAYEIPESSGKNSETSYWGFEIVLKKLESRVNSVVGGDGAIYAIRKSLYWPMDPTDINDFLNPLQIVEHGYKGVFEPAAVCFEQPTDSVDKEGKRKVRIISRSFRSLLKHPQLLNPFKVGFFAVQLFSHKVLRWTVPFTFPAIYGLCLLLQKYPVPKVLFFLQTGFYSVAVAGWATRKARVGKFLQFPYYFCLVNLASCRGVVKAISGDVASVWNIQRNTPGVRKADRV